MIFLKQNTAADLPIGPFLDSTDGVTAETGLTLTQPDIRLKKNGGAWAQKSAAQTLSHEENGWYEVSLSTTDTDTLGVLYLAVAESGALPVWHEYMVMPANVWDSMFGADKLQVHVDEMTAGIITATVIATDAIDADAIADNAINAGAIAADAITAAKIADGAIDAATFAAGAIDAAALAADAGTEIGTAVWATTTRSLTILDEDSTTLDLDATIRGAVGLAAANLDTQLTAIDDLVDTEVAAIKTVVDAILVDTGTDIPATLSALGTATGSALSIDATTDNTAGGISGVTSGTTFVGSQTGTFADTSAQDLAYHVITHSANAFDIVYQFNIGAGTAPVLCIWIGYLSGNNDQFSISAWNHVSGAWDSMATIPGQSGTANITHNCPLFTRYVGTSAGELGKVYIRLHCTGQTSPVLNTDQIYVSYAVTSADISAIKAKTDNLPSDPADASVIAGRFDTLDASVADLPTNAELATSQAAADDATLAAIAALNNLSAAQVNAEVVDALSTDTYAEPGQGSPGATVSLSAKIGYLYKAWRNRTTQTASEYALYGDDAVTKDQEAAVSDDGTTFVRSEVTTGA